MKTWREWNWRVNPGVPRTWPAADQVVLTDGLLNAPSKDYDAAVDALGRLIDPIHVYVEGVDTLATAHQMDGRYFLALSAERQADLNAEENMRAICRVRTARRALVLSPRERLDLNFHGTLPHDWGLGYCSMHARFDLIVVRGPSGPDAWPIPPPWVEDIREQAASVNIAFAFLGWGDWQPLGNGRGTPDRIFDGCRFANVGAHNSGRILYGKTYEQLPEVF